MEKNFDKSNEIVNFHLPRWNELPNIELYIDQVICYLDEYLEKYVGKEKDNHILTKTMINNYVKNSVLQPTNKKRYNKEHIAKLFIICILKQTYSLVDIANLIDMVTKSTTIDKAYDSFCIELEAAINTVFTGEEYIIPKNTTYESYILKRVVLSFANKLYVDKFYLKKF